MAATQDRTPLVDMHCHFMPPDWLGLDALASDARWPRLTIGEGRDTGDVMLGAQLFRTLTAPSWDMAQRIEQMDHVGVDCQVISPIPIALTYWADPKAALGYAQYINDWLAQQVEDSRGRLRGMGTVPLQDPAAAIAEMERARGELRLSGLEIGTIVNGQELGHPSLRPFFRAASEMQFPIFVHPMARYHGYGNPRCEDAFTSNGIDMLTDTSVAASSLVFDGVLEECPDLRMCLSHGGGNFPWVYPRLAYSRVGEGSRARLDQQVAHLYVDALVFDPAHLDLLKTRFGTGHIVGGTDYPFIAGLDDPGAILEQAVALGSCTRAEVDAMKGRNAFEFLQEVVPSFDRS